MLKKFLLVSITTLLSAQYTNCDFKNSHYEEVCNRLVKKKVSVEYANEFLLSSKADKLELKSFEMFQPKLLKTHHANEKKANNTLAKYIPQITKHLKTYSAVYDEAEKRYQVNREIVAAILMKETRLGKIKPRYDAFGVFNTLVLKLDVKSKRDKWLMSMAKTNMVSIISYCYKKGYTPSTCNFASSYAGAVGIPQFMPHNFSHIVGYKKEVGDLNVMADAILSASKFLHDVAGFKTLIDWSKIPSMKEVEEAWYEYDFKHANSSFVYAISKRSNKKYNCFACEKAELEYLRTYAKKIMTYNNSSNYAIGVIRLAYDAHYLLIKETTK